MNPPQLQLPIHPSLLQDFKNQTSYPISHVFPNTKPTREKSVSFPTINNGMNQGQTNVKTKKVIKKKKKKKKGRQGMTVGESRQTGDSDFLYNHLQPNNLKRKQLNEEESSTTHDLME